MPAVRVLVVDDEILIGSLVSTALTSRGYEVRTARSAGEARTVADAFLPEVCFLDIELGKGVSGLDLAHVLLQNKPNTAIIFLTNIPEPRVIGKDNRTVPKNAAYLHKKNLTDVSQLVYAIETVRRKGSLKTLRDDKNKDHALSGVSASQLEVLHLIALGLSNHEIAEHRGTTLRAVENLIKRACNAAGIKQDAGSNQRVNAARKFIEVAGLPQV